jgi:hypothetical protein
VALRVVRNPPAIMPLFGEEQRFGAPVGDPN